MFTELISQ